MQIKTKHKKIILYIRKTFKNKLTNFIKLFPNNFVSYTFKKNKIYRKINKELVIDMRR